MSTRLEFSPSTLHIPLHCNIARKRTAGLIVIEFVISSYSFRSSSSRSLGLSSDDFSRVDTVTSGVSIGDFSSLTTFSCSDASEVGGSITDWGGLGVTTGVAMGLL